MPFLKEDLQYTHYTWENGAFTYAGDPSRRLFDRSNGNQVLFLINCCRVSWELFSLKDLQRIEDRIVHELPSEVKSELSVFQWLRTGLGNTLNIVH